MTHLVVGASRANGERNQWRCKYSQGHAVVSTELGNLEANLLSGSKTLFMWTGGRSLSFNLSYRVSLLFFSDPEAIKILEGLYFIFFSFSSSSTFFF